MQATLSADLTALLRDVLTAWEGPLPRLVYLTDAGYHPTQYFREVLQRMDNPRVPGQRLQWLWIIDFYHAASYVTKLAQVLFSEAKQQYAWARRMRHLLRDARVECSVCWARRAILRDEESDESGSEGVQRSVRLSADAQRR